MEEYNIISQHTDVVECAVWHAENQGFLTDRQKQEFAAIQPGLRMFDILTDVDLALGRTDTLKQSFERLAGYMAVKGLQQDVIERSQE